MELTILKLALPYINWESFGWFLLYTWVLFIGFFVYTAAKDAWPRMLIGPKILVSPVIIVFGAMDIFFDATAGTLMFGLEPPRWLEGEFTFSQRCDRHYGEKGFRGVIADAFCFTLNSISPLHCDKKKKKI